MDQRAASLSPSKRPMPTSPHSVEVNSAAAVTASLVTEVDEQQARAAGLGLWSGAAARPEMFRADVKAAPPPEVTPAGCAIKGNISASGKIFHQPGDLDYSRTRISEAKGERWFCSVDAAMAAGWRAARR